MPSREFIMDGSKKLCLEAAYQVYVLASVNHSITLPKTLNSFYDYSITFEVYLSTSS